MAKASSYTESLDEVVYKLCLLGATDREMADIIGVTEQTLNNWKKAHPSFFESLKRGKEQADAEIAHKLYHRAKGYSHEDTHISIAGGQVIATPIMKHYPPDTTACIFWLKNRQPNLWRDVKAVDVDVNVKADDLSDAQLARIAAGSGRNAPKAKKGQKELH